MASFSMEDFVGDGALKGLLPKLLEEGWDDVPTLKIMNSEDMNAINMSPQQKWLNKKLFPLYMIIKMHWKLDHTCTIVRALMQYGDILEASGKGLPELLNLSTGDMSSQFGMKRGHIARFMDRTSACTSPLHIPPRRTTGTTSRNNSIYKAYGWSANSSKMQNRTGSLQRYNTNSDKSLEQSLADFKIKDGYIFEGTVAAGPPVSRACGCVQPPPVSENVAPYSVIENISVQKLTPEYRIGVERLVKSKTPPMKASELWREMPAVILCIRRPGCIMCRAEAHQLYAKKPIFDALGIQLFAVLHEYIEPEVKDFWPRYWGGVVVYDQGMEFFRALGGGKLLKDKFLSGFLLNPRAIANYKRAKATGAELNLNGEGVIKGGLFIVGGGKSGIAYQFIERNFGDWAPVAELIEICTKLQNHQQGQSDSIKEMQE